MPFSAERDCFLGHKVSEEGMKLGDDGLRAMRRWLPQQTIPRSSGFLERLDSSGALSRTMPPMVRPLNDLLEGKASKWKAQLVDLPPEALEALTP